MFLLNTYFEIDEFGIFTNKNINNIKQNPFICDIYLVRQFFDLLYVLIYFFYIYLYLNNYPFKLLEYNTF